jgi:CheY-like chemotaxis protein
VDITVSSDEEEFDNETDELSKILIVDDQSFNIEAATVILKYSVRIKNPDQICDSAIHGKQALEKVIQDVESHNLKHCSYKLIIMDCNMPIMDGYEATSKIRSYISSLGINQPIIIAVTGHTEEEYVRRAMSSGMNQVLSKPIIIEVLKDIVS